MTKNSIIVFGGMLLIIFALVAYMIFSEPVKVIEPFDETPFREEIARQDSIADLWKEEFIKQQTIAKEALNKVDSLEKLKPSINEDHDNQINLNASASDQQLDSVIRANW